MISPESTYRCLAMQGCDASWEGEYDASTPVFEILNAYCGDYGLHSASCKLYMNNKELPKSKLFGQVFAVLFDARTVNVALSLSNESD